MFRDWNITSDSQPSVYFVLIQLPGGASFIYSLFFPGRGRNVIRVAASFWNGGREPADLDVLRP
jgi:hypothetical protein